MFKKFLIFLGVTLILLASNPVTGRADIDEAPDEGSDLSTLQFDRIAVMPFIIGKLESPDNPVEKPLSLSLQRLNAGAVNLEDGVDQTMTRLVHKYLQVRHQNQIVPLEAATTVYAAVSSDPMLDTPRKLAVKFGEKLQADLVVVGSIWRFREKGANKEIQNSPASVAFAVYLVDVASGKRLWRNAFDGTQKILSEDVLGGLRQVKIDLRWLSATDLARLGVKAVFRKFPLR